MYIYVLYSGKFSTTINFAVFKNFTATSKINSLKRFYSTDCYDHLYIRSSKINLQNLSWRDNSENFLPWKLPTIYVATVYIHIAIYI